MRRTAKTWVVVNKRGRIPFHDPVQRVEGPVGQKRSDVEAWGNQVGDRIVRGFITYDDVRPAPRKRRARKVES